MEGIVQRFRSRRLLLRDVSDLKSPGAIKRLAGNFGIGVVIVGSRRETRAVGVGRRQRQTHAATEVPRKTIISLRSGDRAVKLRLS